MCVHVFRLDVSSSTATSRPTLAVTTPQDHSSDLQQSSTCVSPAGSVASDVIGEEEEDEDEVEVEGEEEEAGRECGRMLSDVQDRSSTRVSMVFWEYVYTPPL